MYSASQVVTKYKSTFSQTVILDCCHSGSGTRADSSVTSTRGFTYEKKLPKNLDAKLLTGDGNTRGVKLAAGFLNHGLESHVLLAACNSNEVAREAKGRGAFTTALLATLATVLTDKISYTDLLRRIDALPMLAKFSHSSTMST